ncbi:hypothetical protein [Streptomyces sp. NBC_01614]|uniref:Uncharacterized protein n=1 Tax=Streptomyces sp. NBC_00180 TaxID=2903632 RepID=A0AAU1ICN9_9ACTN
MSTALIARPTPSGFTGRFCTRGGSPDRLEGLLLRAVTHYFHGHVAVAQAYLIDAHPAGWYRIGGDFTSETGYRHDKKESLANLCYCHGETKAPPRELDATGAAEAGVDWAYVLETDHLKVLTPVRNGWYEVRSTPWPYLPLAVQHSDLIPAISAA